MINKKSARNALRKKFSATGNFLKLPNLIVSKYMRGLGGTTFRLLMALIFLDHRFGRGFYYTDQKIEAEFGISRSSIQRAREELKTKGFIAYKAGFRSEIESLATTYEIFPTEELRNELNIPMIQKELKIEPLMIQKESPSKKISNLLIKKVNN